MYIRMIKFLKLTLCVALFTSVQATYAIGNIEKNRLSMDESISPIDYLSLETSYFDTNPAEKTSRKSGNSKPETLLIAWGWCLVDDGTGDIIWVWHW